VPELEFAAAAVSDEGGEKILKYLVTTLTNPKKPTVCEAAIAAGLLFLHLCKYVTTESTYSNIIFLFR